jgi:hypothetical protein
MNTLLIIEKIPKAIIKIQIKRMLVAVIFNLFS